MSTSTARRDMRLMARREWWRRARRMKLLYLAFALPFVALVIFRYVPIYGIIIAFKDFNIGKGFWKSEWNNFENFRLLFESRYFWRILRNTIVISVLKILFGFPAPIILAIMINEIRNPGLKKAIQSISYLPHFMSWVVLSGIIIEIVSPDRGIVGHVFALLNRPAPNLLTNRRLFRPLLVTTDIWQSVGWSSIVYLAAITSIDPQLYEAAAVDGASRFQMASRITIPSLVPVMTVLFILRLGRILNAGFDQIFNLYNPLVYEVADIIDTYVYRVGILDRRFEFATAVGLFKSGIGVALIVGSNAVIRRFSEYGVW